MSQSGDIIEATGKENAQMLIDLWLLANSLLKQSLQQRDDLQVGGWKKEREDQTQDELRN